MESDSDKGKIGKKKLDIWLVKPFSLFISLADFFLLIMVMETGIIYFITWAMYVSVVVNWGSLKTWYWTVAFFFLFFYLPREEVDGRIWYKLVLGVGVTGSLKDHVIIHVFNFEKYAKGELIHEDIYFF